ncbi:MAG: hypothetical protein COA79_03065 [Planctomycetota bacterium]|nr:MAG: hypothetical protein COA79_03065 [Planctomycetota bacterium]
MYTIKTTDLILKKQTKREHFFSKELRVISRSGLHMIEKNLIEQLREYGTDGEILILENRTGVLPMAYQHFYPNSNIDVQNLDIHHSKTVLRTFKQNEFNKLTPETKATLDETKKYDLIIFQLAVDVETELIQDILQQIHISLNKNGFLIISRIGKSQFILNNLKTIFGGSSLLQGKKSGQVDIAKKKNELKKIKNFKANFELTLTEKQPILLASIPGVFAHRRVDQGALAIIESIELKEKEVILDLGCGCGSMGITLGKQNETTEVHFVDSSARAIHMTNENAEANQLENYFVHLSDEGIKKKNHFTLVVGNPPYFSDYKIAEMFLQNAYNNLKKGGRIFIVAKSIEWYIERMQSLFGNQQILNRRGYKIITSTK